MTASTSPNLSRLGQLNLSFLLNLRWGAVVGQSLAVLIADKVLKLRLPLVPLLVVLLVMALTNLALTAWRARVHEVSDRVVMGVMTLDVVLLTCQLYFTGGPDNPFHTLYIIHIALAGIMLPARWGWGLVAVAGSAFVILWWHHLPLQDTLGPLEAGLTPALSQWGKGVAFLLAACFVVHFVHRCTAALAATEAQLATARDLSARNGKLTSLVTLAAGAAHELSTPLATIAIVAKELERQLDPAATHAREDACLIRREVERCRRVLHHMAVDAGEHAGEPLVNVRAEELIAEALGAVPGRQRVQVTLEPSVLGITLVLPQRSIAQSIRAATKNAVEASPQGTVRLRAWATAQQLFVEVRDSGLGMSAATLARIGEPFYTTKGPGRGMGLGLFLTRTVLERLGGGLDIQSTLGQGSTVLLTLPRAALNSGAEHGADKQSDNSLDPDRGRRRDPAQSIGASLS